MTHFASVPSIGQLHENSCWAACLAWFLKADNDGRPSWTQKEIIKTYWRSVDQNGALFGDYSAQLWRDDQRLRMNTRVHATPNAELDSLPLGSKPVCIAFKHITGFAHMNVIWKVDTRTVMCMEPFWPHPGRDGNRTGRMVRRDIEHFNYGDNVVLAWAVPPDGRSTSVPADAG